MAWSSKVAWSEGMFLRPAHFQQHVRYVENLLEQRCRSLQAHAVGFTRLELDPALLRLGKIALTYAEGVLPDGTPFSIPHDDDAPPAFDVAPGSDDQGVIYLSLPVRRHAAAEFAFDDSTAVPARYGVREIDALDTCTPSASASTIQVGQLKLALLPERTRHGDVVTLGIARVIERRDDGGVVLDETYLPPALDCRAVPPLATGLKELQGLLRHRAEALAGRVSAAARGGMSEVADFLLLQLANRYEAQLAHLAARGCVHPHELHALAIQLAAELATFTRSERRPPEFPAYQHHDLAQTFGVLMTELRRSLSMVFEQSAIALPLEERKHGVRVSALADRSLLTGATFVLAARASVPAEELRRRFPLQAKLGSAEQIRQLVNLQLPGVALRPLPVAPRQLPYHAGFVYFELDKSGDAWAALAQSAGFALHVSGEFPGLELEFWAVRE